MATALVTGIVTMMFNWTMLKYVGENGVAAITIIMYVLMFATSLYTGYSYGVAPMISFYYGESKSWKIKKADTYELEDHQRDRCCDPHRFAGRYRAACLGVRPPR